MTPPKSHKLLAALEDHLTRHVVFSRRDQPRVIAMWVLHTWAFDSARTTPYLYLHSPEPQSGKSLLVEVLASVVRNPMKAIDVTGPVLFRAIDKFSPTVLLDEVDQIWHGARHDGLRGIVNGGYKEGGQVWRLERGQPLSFDTFCPKLLAGIYNGYLPDTIVDRCLPITMRRKDVGGEVEPFYLYEREEEIEQLLVEIDAWVLENTEALREYRQRPVDGLSDRESEIAWPLLAIASRFGMDDEVAASIAEMIEGYRESMPETDTAVVMIRKIGELFRRLDRRKIHTEEMLLALDMAPNEGKLLSVYLDRYDIHPHSIRIGNRVARGYTAEQFSEVFAAHAINLEKESLHDFELPV